ncbi:MAG: cation:dicarboxylase symporter family transporter, partial [Planctomycetales bacterium]|nr:cation:dicarboxylase symporter family transporter [Planctomycetales bacterium]
GGLLAIIVGIVLGALLGGFYGQPMWVAGGGPEELLHQLEATRQQKEEFAAALDRSDPPEAARLRGHIPQIDARIAEVQQQQAAAAPSTLAYASWEFAKFCGELFLQVLKLLVIPLVVTSMICGITALGDVRNLGKIGGWTLVYYMATAGAAVLLGIVLVQILQPGVDADDTFAYVTESVMAKEGTNTLETLLNVFRGQEGQPHTGMFPGNIFLAASHTNVLALIVFALVFGAALTTIGERGKVAIDFFQAANLAVMKMVHIVMWFAPLGIFGLVAFNIAKKGGGAAFGTQVAQLSKYVFTVGLGLLLHSILLTVLLWLLTRRNPFRYLYGVARALLTAATTASSSATLPVSMECVEENNDVSNKTASFVLPLGATINMDGTALYEAVAVIFIAQSMNVPLS